MNIRDLEYLIAVHDLKNFSRAAQQCFVSQPTLSGQLKKLEAELGVELMERSTRQVFFTPLGENVVEQARKAIAAIDSIRNKATNSEDPMAGDFHLGLIPTIGPFLLPIIMPALNEAYPKLDLYLYELKTEDLLEKLSKGEIDAGILAKLDWPHAVLEIDLYDEALQLAVSKDDTLLSGSKLIKLDALDDQHVLMLEDGHCLRNQALDVCFSAGAKEDQRFKATSMDTLLHMVATGAGMTLIPELATRSRVQGIRYIAFSDPVPHREIVMLSRKTFKRTNTLNNIASTIIKAVSN